MDNRAGKLFAKHGASLEKYNNRVEQKTTLRNEQGAGARN
jgi:hypothetical protein